MCELWGPVCVSDQGSVGRHLRRVAGAGSMNGAFTRWGRDCVSPGKPLPTSGDKAEEEEAVTERC